MNRNVGGLDRTLRIVLGVGLAAVSMAVVAFGTSLGTQVQMGAAGVALLLAAVLLATAGAETCPVNSVLGRNTYRGGRRL